MDVGTTRFDTNRTYATYELAPALFPGGNHTFGLMLGQGFCQGYQALLQLHLWDAQDNLLSTVGTDTSWLTSQGPILADSTYYGIPAVLPPSRRHGRFGLGCSPDLIPDGVQERLMTRGRSSPAGSCPPFSLPTTGAAQRRAPPRP